ncbi:MAG: NADP-dependent malic enzyme [Aggregatilineales bacterium]
MSKINREDALNYHREGRPGKIEVTTTKPLVTQRDLSLAYSPGVAEAVLEIDENPLSVYELTAKANLVAVVTNGSAILGLGDRGAMASKPVMEGKAGLFKRFADIDVFDIELDTESPEEIIATCKAIAPTFGGINLEDIKAPECFEIEARLREMLDIPVFHDDQHGTAIITGAALMNACEITERRVDNMRIVIVGAGAAGVATARFYVTLGVPRDNIVMVDIHGVVYAGREVEMDEYKGEFATDREIRTLAEALDGADMVVGLSAAGVIKQEMLLKMAPNPVILALANPTPEILPHEAMAARPDALVGTGRSDYPNQVNNVLGFPYIFRGALDVYARQINDEMKIAAAKAVAALAHEDVPDSVIAAYGGQPLRFGRNYLIPKPLDPRVLLWVAPAVAQAAMDSGMARRNLNMDEYREYLIARQGHGRLMRNTLVNKARVGIKKRIVLAEGEETKIIRAAMRILDEGIGEPILLGRKDKITDMIQQLGFPAVDIEIIDPFHTALRDIYAERFYEKRQRKGVTQARAYKLMRDRNFFGPMMVLSGDADVFLSGLTYEYPEVVRPALQIFGTRHEARIASGVYLIIVRGQVYIFTDATVNIDPNAEQLSDIAILAADFAKTLGLEPRVAMLSFSNFGSTPHPASVKVQNATQLVREKRPDIAVDGEMQADTAVVTRIIEERYPFSQVHDANVLVFPNLSAANISYKLLSRLSDAEAIGPILLGMGAPVHVLQSGDDVENIVTMAAISVTDARERFSRGY